MNHYLKCVSIVALILLCACHSTRPLLLNHFSGLELLKYKPQYDKKVYRTVIDGKFLFKKFHLSGILFIKKLADSSTRIIFQNEVGFNYFDFEIAAHTDSFQVMRITPQMDKEPLIKLLRKDFYLLLMKGYDYDRYISDSASPYSRSYSIPLEKGYAFYHISQDDNIKDINVMGNKVITSYKLYQYDGNNSYRSLPDSIFIDHHKANFTITLSALNNESN